MFNNIIIQNDTKSIVEHFEFPALDGIGIEKPYFENETFH